MNYGMMRDELEPFWLVWNPNKNAPTHKHLSEANAIAEAERLARKYKGEKFIVLGTRCVRVVDDMQRLELVADPNQLPF